MFWECFCGPTPRILKSRYKSVRARLDTRGASKRIDRSGAKSKRQSTRESQSGWARSWLGAICPMNGLLVRALRRQPRAASGFLRGALARNSYSVPLATQPGGWGAGSGAAARAAGKLWRTGERNGERIGERATTTARPRATRRRQRRPPNSTAPVPQRTAKTRCLSRPSRLPLASRPTR